MNKELINIPCVRFEQRLVFDKDFFDSVKKVQGRPSVLTKLMNINDRATPNRRKHNIMSAKMFDEILQENKRIPRNLLRSFFYEYEVQELEELEDETERVIKIAIDLLNEVPYKTYILTTDEKKAEYESNPHYKGVKEIDVKSGEEALTIIDDFFRRVTAK